MGRNHLYKACLQGEIAQVVMNLPTHPILSNIELIWVITYHLSFITDVHCGPYGLGGFTDPMVATLLTIGWLYRSISSSALSLRPRRELSQGVSAPLPSSPHPLKDGTPTKPACKGEWPSVANPTTQPIEAVSVLNWVITDRDKHSKHSEIKYYWEKTNIINYSKTNIFL